MKQYKLLTPGPLSTSKTVKEQMLFDSCTWDDSYKNVVQTMRQDILDVLNLDQSYEVGLMQGSGTFSVEATLGSACSELDTVLVLSNGAYGARIAEIMQYSGQRHHVLEFSETSIINVDVVDDFLCNNPEITHVSFVHLETTTGILNPLAELCCLLKKHDKIVIVDAMSSLFGVAIDICGLDIDYLISSSNKCVQGVPGFGIVIFKSSLLAQMQGNSTSLSLDLYDQVTVMNHENGKWRFTSPTHVVLAFSQALKELKSEGLTTRIERYRSNQALLVKLMDQIGYETCLNLEVQSSVITTFLFYKHPNFTFIGLYEFLKENGFVIYPGKLSNLEVFRIGNIGEVFEEDIISLCNKIKIYTRGLDD